VGGGQWGAVGGWGGKSFKKQKKKRNWVGAGEKIKFQKKKKTGKGAGGRDKIKLQKETEIRAEKRQRKKFNLGWHTDRKEKPISAPSIHVGALVGAGSLWPHRTSSSWSWCCSFVQW
jgi:hypothetical protein